MREISVPKFTYSPKVAAVQRLLLAGISRLTFTILVSSLMGLGVTVILAPLIPATFIMSFATFSASATDAPGTMTLRAAS